MTNPALAEGSKDLGSESNRSRDEKNFLRTPSVEFQKGWNMREESCRREAIESIAFESGEGVGCPGAGVRTGSDRFLSSNQDTYDWSPQKIVRRAIVERCMVDIKQSAWSGTVMGVPGRKERQALSESHLGLLGEHGPMLKAGKDDAEERPLTRFIYSSGGSGKRGGTHFVYVEYPYQPPNVFRDQHVLSSDWARVGVVGEEETTVRKEGSVRSDHVDLINSNPWKFQSYLLSYGACTLQKLPVRQALSCQLWFNRGAKVEAVPTLAAVQRLMQPSRRIRRPEIYETVAGRVTTMATRVQEKKRSVQSSEGRSCSSRTDANAKAIERQSLLRLLSQSSVYPSPVAAAGCCYFEAPRLTEVVFPAKASKWRCREGRGTAAARGSQKQAVARERGASARQAQSSEYLTRMWSASNRGPRGESRFLQLGPDMEPTALHCAERPSSPIPPPIPTANKCLYPTPAAPMRSRPWHSFYCEFFAHRYLILTPASCEPTTILHDSTTARSKLSA
ncbi:uncharacterized protein BDR25DRAFT_350036 [Lindgomyces ingoldianus]|uniref:Uncharacterized protein n=1 Tax=Lindgomyces ingoldianus TaxID=673940 RepID=A0ACB6RB97_9PLEO|nr:uncharacterized protein BDR25DRAFT_350036 [Lindgomyces ingoldianus]KAF2475746.1 hypothetical protein BDR25DRAFT_350036 [Lindgomyces ingoldianus]